MQVQIGRRLVWLSAIVLLMLAALGGRLYHLQVVKNVEYTQIAHDQRTLSVPLTEGRGLIVDRNGEPLSDPRQSWQIAAFLPLMTDGGTTEAEELSRLLGEPLVDLLEAFPDKGAAWLDPAVPLTEEQAAMAEEAGLTGIALGSRQERVGPDALARQLMGYANARGGAQGLELAFDKELKGGAAPALTAYLDGRGNPLAGLGIRAVVSTADKEPYQVVTTIDKRFQAAVEEALDKRGNTLPAAAVVMDPATGEVLAMASRPEMTYPVRDPNSPTLYNRAVREQPPGSSFKAIIAAAALEAGKVKPDERFYCDGHEEFNGWNVTDAGHGWLTFRDAVAKSCNIVFAKVGVERLGIKGMREAAQRFGFGAETLALGRPWADEHPGAIPGLTDPSAPQMSIGQGSLEVTPLQLARAYSAIANGGNLPAAKLIRAVKSPAGEVVERPAAGRPQRVISKETAATVQKLLAGVTEPGKGGTGQLAWVAGAGSAGKTGSAETAAKGVIHAWFAGYLPQFKPKWVIVVLVEDGKWGSQAAAPIFSEIGRRLLAITGY